MSGNDSARSGEGIRGRVTVVMNFLNAADFIDEAVASVYAQSYPDWEMLLVDDGSTDRSTAIARGYAERDSGRVRYLEFPGHENRGASAARNLGILEARGEFIAFLDSDDVWLPHRIARSVELLARHPGADMVYGESEYWFSWAGDGAPHPDRIQPQGFDADRVVTAPELLVRHLMHAASVPCTSSITVRRDAAISCGGFVESFKGMHDDQAFLARLCVHNDVFVSHECWERYRQHPASLCAEAERNNTVGKARRRYLAWLRSFLEEQGLQGSDVWVALRYAEQVDRLPQRGLAARGLRSLLRSLARVRMAVTGGRRRRIPRTVPPLA